MSTPSLARRLRHSLCDVASTLGPDAPTLCSPWQVRDLLAHLVVRERRPDALPGIGGGPGPLGRHTERVQDGWAARPFPELVAQVRSGPAAWWPTRAPALDRIVNTAEMAIHREDLLRGGAELTEPAASFDAELDAALWDPVQLLARATWRSLPVGVVLIAPGHGRRAVHRPSSGVGSVVVTGRPLELAMEVFGRGRVANVELAGAPEDVRLFSEPAGER